MPTRLISAIACDSQAVCQPRQTSLEKRGPLEKVPGKQSEKDMKNSVLSLKRFIYRRKNKIFEISSLSVDGKNRFLVCTCWPQTVAPAQGCLDFDL